DWPAAAARLARRAAANLQRPSRRDEPGGSKAGAPGFHRGVQAAGSQEPFAPQGEGGDDRLAADQPPSPSNVDPKAHRVRPLLHRELVVVLRRQDSASYRAGRLHLEERLLRYQAVSGAGAAVPRRGRRLQAPGGNVDHVSGALFAPVHRAIGQVEKGSLVLRMLWKAGHPDAGRHAQPEALAREEVVRLDGAANSLGNLE